MEQNNDKNTPLMQQYLDIKAQYPDTLLFFQVGDFFELFFDDAKVASSFLAIALTKRGKNKGEDIPLCGVPVHALDHYVTKLIKGSFRVALCEQLSKPQPGTVVQRGITRVFTPATLTDAAMLEEKSASYLLALYPGPTEWGLIFSELLTAQLFATTIPANATRMVEAELIRFFPDEIIVPESKRAPALATYFKKLGYCTSTVQAMEGEQQNEDRENLWITQQFPATVHSQLNSHPAISSTLQLLYWYLKRNQEKALEQFKTIHFYQPDDYLILDAATQKNLEIIHNTRDGSTQKTLFSVLDRAHTPMGSRTIKKWLARPLMQHTAIMQRQEIVGLISSRVDLLHQSGQLLEQLPDIERIIGRIALKRVHLHDYCALRQSLNIVPLLKTLLTQIPTNLSQMLNDRIADFSALEQLLTCSITDDPSSKHPIKHGYDHQLDQLRNLLENGKQEFLNLEQREIARTGITSLKIGYNQVSGYYIEVTNPNLDKVPTDYQHQQTLANRKRFVTQELRELEQNLYKAHNEFDVIQAEVFDRIKREIETYLPQLRHLAQSLATFDALYGFASAAYEYRYCAPTFNENRNISITNGRHPVVEQSLGNAFVPNDTHLYAPATTWIITGPNMGGKSTYLRQVALMCIMAQAGSFVPADAANLAIIDRIFTRIGSGDNVAEGKSTFLVEMEETATICTQATARSVVILDEVGRGTSTYDGMALAQAIIEFIHQKIGALCLFATHYHELTHLSETIPGITNYHAACKKINDSVIFIHKIVPGVAQGSFGLEVARLANLPTDILVRAAAILQHMETPSRTQVQQLPLFAQPTSQSPVTLPCQQCTAHETLVQRIKALDCTNVTPKQAFDFLWDLTQEVRSS